jgi:hypothetical protein
MHDCHLGSIKKFSIKTLLARFYALITRSNQATKPMPRRGWKKCELSLKAHSHV